MTQRTITTTGEHKLREEATPTENYRNKYSLVDSAKISALRPSWPQEDVRDTWKLILKPFFPTEVSQSPNGNVFRVEPVQIKDEFPQIIISNPQGPWESLPLFTVYCINWPEPDADMWKFLEGKAKWDLLTVAQSFEAYPRPSISLALAVGPLVRFYKFDHELDYCHIDYRKDDSLNIHEDFDDIVEELLEIRQDMT
ncbi:uncharacterized protein ACLA_043410 [Aspergillus clavatus NRRL 1]|uniref:Uncharacterized protein n=1 Tax=Aspergillus clavatus (strain ATCC 1007 / CBS 513.65 / DSM 816 / NCTC 3887 / NRRL 1 / QM 1276 / 107) TaxID=344612 RepID=A1C8I5_ASPCL|nr:uncharacterized protein ACLA_043410 [Aspergillus clavatus NRRL 1]EAW13622.1 conserved hypothetical protein [Aspergillus clavatus NRRL 1]